MKVLKGDARELVRDVASDAFIISDPPYNQGYHYAAYSDNLLPDDYARMLLSVFRPSRSVIIHYPEEMMSLFGGGRFSQYPPQQVVSWVYNSNTAKQHRLVTWWGCKPDFRLIPQAYKNSTDKRIAARIAAGKTARSYDWWEINQVKNVSKADNPHPCPIPYELARRIIVSTTKKGDLVCDPFAGSGTILKAAQDLGRRVIGFDLDQSYVDHANRLLG